MMSNSSGISEYSKALENFRCKLKEVLRFEFVEVFIDGDQSSQLTVTISNDGDWLSRVRLGDFPGDSSIAVVRFFRFGTFERRYNPIMEDFIRDFCKLMGYHSIIYTNFEGRYVDPLFTKFNHFINRRTDNNIDMFYYNYE